jgi:hypothetical protein
MRGFASKIRYPLLSLMDDQAIHFSPNLNCIVGGRGTGKSTAFEAVRCLSGRPSGSDVDDSEIWPVRLDLYWRDQASQIHSLSRPVNGNLENLKDPLKGPVSLHIECYGQGDVSRGSIDDLQTREDACNVLEGTREAFERRARIYGLMP